MSGGSLPSPGTLDFTLRHVPHRLPCTIFDPDLDVRIALDLDDAPRFVGDGESACSAVRARVVGVVSVAADLAPLTAGAHPAAIARLFDVDAIVTVSDRRCVVVGGFGWSVDGMVDLSASVVLLASFEHSSVAAVEARRTGIARRRIAVDVISLDPASALHLQMRGTRPAEWLQTFASPIVDDRLRTVRDPEERRRLEAVRAGSFADDRDRIGAWIARPGTELQSHRPASPGVDAGAAAGPVSLADAPDDVGSWWSDSEPAALPGERMSAGAPWWNPSAGDAADRAACASCGTRLKPGAQFCGSCGRPITEPAP